MKNDKEKKDVDEESASIHLSLAGLVLFSLESFILCSLGMRKNHVEINSKHCFHLFPFNLASLFCVSLISANYSQSIAIKALKTECN